MPRKLVFYTYAFGGGGAEIVFARLAEAFATAGDQVIFAADCRGPGRPHDRSNLKHVVLGANHFVATIRLAALLRREKPGASFSALGAQNLKHLAAAMLTGRRRRAVLGFHGFAAAEARFLSRSCFWASPVVTRLAARTICVSDALLRDMRRRWHASRSRTVRIYNPVNDLPDTGLRAAASTPTADEAPLILGCGRLVAGKRFDDLVEAFAMVEPATARLAIVGTGPERAAILALAQRRGLADRIEMPGYVEDMAPWYRRASCVAITSETESFGLTAAEALLHGKPVVATDCGGPVEILAGGLFGRIVPIGDVSALATALTETIAAPGPAADRRARAECFSLATAHGSYAELADSLSPPAGARSASR